MVTPRLENTIRTRRFLANLTQEQLADAVGVTRQTIIAMEKGNYIPSVLLAMRLSAHLACTVEELFHEKND